MALVAVTGATGQLGRRVAELLGERVDRLIVRDPSRAPALPARPDVRTAAYDDAAAARAALAGVRTLFMVSAAESATRRAEHRTFVRAAADAGVQHIVYTSFCAAAPEATFTLGRDHWDTEQAIRASGLSHTFLRDNFYADFFPLFADEHGVIRGLAGTGRVAAVARADVADVAVTVLAEPTDHRDRTYTLTGPEAFTMAEAATRLTSMLGQAYTYVEQTLDEAYRSRRVFSDEQWQLDAWVSTYTAIADGSCAEVTDDVPRLTGHPARRLEDAVRS